MSSPAYNFDDLRIGYFELVASRPAYERAAAFYEGTVEEIMSSPKVTKLLARFGLNSIESMNFAHIPVDAVANKLHINSITADKQDNTKGIVSKNEEVNQVIEDLMDYNELEEELRILFRKAGIYGDFYMMVWPKVGDETNGVSKGFDARKMVRSLVQGEPVLTDDEIATPGNKTIVAVDMTLMDPLTTRVFYDTENPREKKYAIRSWEEGEGQERWIRANLYYPDRIERWKHKGRPSRRKTAQQKWIPFTDDGRPAVLPNPFDEVPFFHFRTDRTYGVPDHINAYGPQLAINKIVTSHLATIDYQSFPQRYALLDPTADPSGVSGVDSDPFAPEDIGAFPEDDDNESQLEADPGVLWQLSGMKAVGQFEAANSDAYLKPFDRYVKALAQATETPFHYFDRTGERPPSGENIRQVNESLNAKAGARQTSYGSELRKSITFALNMLGHDVERINVVWEPLENVTSLIEWQAINEKVSAGVPWDVALVEAGYRAEVVAQWKLDAEKAAEDEIAQQLAADQAQKKMQHEIMPKGQPSPSIPTGAPKVETTIKGTVPKPKPGPQAPKK